MEEVLETYAEAYDPQQPVVCMDEQPVQLLMETQVPIAATKEHGSVSTTNTNATGRRAFSCSRNRCLAFDRRRPASAGPRSIGRSKWPSCWTPVTRTAQVTLVCDNLNTHTKGAFYTAFPAEKARAYIKRINFCYTPKHGSWLNIAECDLSCMTSQCLSDRRIGELPLLQSEIGIWADKTNAKQRGVDWQFNIDDARTKLKRLYPKIKSG